MYRTKDLYMMEVRDIKGKRQGVIKDIAINFSQGKLVGFILKGGKIIFKEDVIYFNEIMIAKEINSGKFLSFNSVKGMDVIGRDNCLVGRVEELMFNIENWRLNGIIVASGIITDVFFGKSIIDFSDLILGEKNILHTTNNKRILKSKIRFS